MARVNYVLRRARERADQHIRAAVGRRSIHFLHIGKTGGSAVRAALEQFSDPPGFQLYLHTHGTTLTDVPRGERVVFFVRDPISRFISGFYSRRRRGRPKTDIPWSDAETRAFNRFETPNELGLVLANSAHAAHHEAQRAMTCIQHVRNPLSDWLKSPVYVRNRSHDILLAGFQASLDNDFEILKSQLGLDPEITLPRDDITAHRNPAGLDTHLDASAALAIRGWYQADYDLLDTCRMLRRDGACGDTADTGLDGRATVLKSKPTGRS